MKLTAVVLVVVLFFVAGTEGLWENRKVNCGVSVFGKWGPWSAPAPDGSRSRSRTITRRPRNGGLPCPPLIETQDRQDPWSEDNVAVKLKTNFMSGHTTYYNFERRRRRRWGVGKNGQTLLARDILFLIDMSGSISEIDWTTTKQTLVELIKKICGTIGHGDDKNRIAIITFSTEVMLNFDFKTHWTIDSVSRAIMNMPQARRGTCTGKALDYANTYMFDTSKGIRSATESVKDVMVLTDGRSNCGANLAVKVAPLHLKAFVFAMAIGKYDATRKAEIESMVSKPIIKHIFSLKNFVVFKEMVDFIYSYYDIDECASLEQ